MLASVGNVNVSSLVLVMLGSEAKRQPCEGADDPDVYAVERGDAMPQLAAECFQ